MNRKLAAAAVALALLASQIRAAEEKKSETALIPISGEATIAFPTCLAIDDGFSDVPADSTCPFIRELFNDGVSGGCAAGKFCPSNPVTRGQLAVFLERVMRGGSTWDAWTDGPISPSGLDWGSITPVGGVGTMMEWVRDPSEVSGIYFDGDSAILWSPGDAGLFRVFDSDNGTSLEALRVNTTGLSFRPLGPAADVELRFFGTGQEGRGILRWQAASDDFQFNADIELNQAGAGVANSVGSLRLDAKSTVHVNIDSDTGGTGEFFFVEAGPTTLARFRQDDQSLEVNGNVSANAFDLAESFVRGELLEAGDVVRISPSRPDTILKASARDAGAALGVLSTKPGFHLGGTIMDEDALAQWSPEVRARFSSTRANLRQQVLARQPDLARRLETAVAHLANAPDESGRKTIEEVEKKIGVAVLDLYAESVLAPVALSGRVPVKVDATFGRIAIGDPLAASPIAGVAMRANRPGLVLGTALESMNSGRGKIMMFVNRGWWGGSTAAVAGTEAKPGEATADQAAGPDSVVDEALNTGSVDVHDAWTLRARGGGHAEVVAVSEAVEEGDVLVMDDRDAYRPSGFAEDATVVGVATSRPALLGGARLQGERAAAVVSGITRVKVDATWGPIHRGDLLVSSPTRGHAMRADDPPAGTILGKALESFEGGTGTIRVLVMLR